MPDSSGDGCAVPKSAADRTASPPAGFIGIPAAAVPWLAGGLLALAIGLVYGRALRAPFVFDDHPSILANHSIRKLWPLWDGAAGATPLSPPEHSATAGRPLVNLALAANYAIGQFDPLGYHLFNLFVHLLASFLLFAIVRRTLRLQYFQGRFDGTADPLAFLVALVWALHPLQTEAVQYVTQRTELLMGLFYLTTVYSGLRYFTASSLGWRITWCLSATMACVFGMACKEVMVTAPVMVLLFERTFIAGSFRKAIQTSWRLYAGLALGWVLLLVLNYGGPRSTTTGFGHDVPAYAWWLMQTKAFEMYLKLAFWPQPLVIQYQLPLYTSPLQVWPSLLLVGILAINTIVRLWQRRPTGFLGAWVFLILSPTLTVPIITEHAAERRMYLSLAAIVVFVVIGGYTLLQNAMRQQDADRKKPSNTPLMITFVVALVVAGVFGFLSTRRLAVYGSAVSLWQDALVHQPNNYYVLSNLARVLLLDGQEREAEEYYERALTIKQEFVQRDWGIALLKLDRPKEGIAHFEEAMRLYPEWEPQLRYELGILLLNAERPHQAVGQFKQAVQGAPNSAEKRRYLGVALLQAGRAREAIQPLGQAIRLEPDSAELRELLAGATNSALRAEEAVNRLRANMGKEPKSAKIHFELASALLGTGQIEEAITELREVLRLQPDFPKATAKLQQAVEAQRE